MNTGNTYRQSAGAQRHDWWVMDSVRTARDPRFTETGIILIANSDPPPSRGPVRDFDGATLVQCMIDMASSVPGAASVVVLGPQAGRIRAELGPEVATVIENSQWRMGTAGSIRLGLRALLSACPALTRVLVMECDRPLLSASHLRQLLATHSKTELPVAATIYQQRLDLPAVFAATLFPELFALHGHQSGRDIIHAHCLEAATVPFIRSAAGIALSQPLG